MFTCVQTTLTEIKSSEKNMEIKTFQVICLVLLIAVAAQAENCQVANQAIPSSN